MVVPLLAVEEIGDIMQESPNYLVVFCARAENLPDKDKYMQAIQEQGYECMEIDDPERLRTIDSPVYHLIAVIHERSWTDGLYTVADIEAYKKLYGWLLAGCYGPLRIARTKQGRTTDLIVLNVPDKAFYVGIGDWVTISTNEAAEAVVKAIRRVINFRHQPPMLLPNDRYIV